jgi:dihydroxy-acid dehydratase
MRRCHPHDGMVAISGNDQSVPAHLMAMARCDLPAVLVPGGTQLNAPDYVTSDEMWPMGAAVKRGELAEDELELAQRGACPTCGACQFMGSASTGQVLAEALGLALPGSALVPQPLTKLLRYARAAGKQVLRLIAEDITPRRILTREAFENAIVVHAAIGGSTNALLHLPVIAAEAGVEVTIDDFDRIHRSVPVLANVKSTGRYPVEFFWYAGGVPALGGDPPFCFSNESRRWPWLPRRSAPWLLTRSAPPRRPSSRPLRVGRGWRSCGPCAGGSPGRWTTRTLRPATLPHSLAANWRSARRSRRS